jgi:hypothetical protein
MSRPVHEQIADFIDGESLLCVVKAPPGSGKTYNLLEAIENGVRKGLRIAIAAQTNNQVDDVCTRFALRYPNSLVHRFSSTAYQAPADLPDNVEIVTKKNELPDGPCTMVSTISKLGLTEINKGFDVLLIDEAWQMTWAAFLTVRDAAPRYVLIGDPGQIPPTVTVDCDRWETSGVEPHYPAPTVVLSIDSLARVTTVLALDVCRRLPLDSVELIRNFYDFDFGASAQPGERFLRTEQRGDGSAVDRAIDLAERHSSIILAYPSGEDGSAIETDSELANHVARLASRLLERRSVMSTSPAEAKSPRRLDPDDIGIVSTHNLMNSTISAALTGDARRIRVTTPERWQGLERAVMIAVHPLSGVSIPSSFDLETGRLCVMASRHRSACIFVSRDHVGTTLATRLPIGDHAIGSMDVSGKGHAQHTAFWRHHSERGLIITAP